LAFQGLFIGVDRYRSNRINWLSCACRDATALHAIFSDTLGGSPALLLDDGATRAAIQGEFERLARCDPDDVAVIGFSGHGSDTHELVAFDSTPEDLASTGIPLDLVAEWFARIPARRLVLLLDCCFSGGMGSKVLHADAVPRDLRSVDARLAAISGEGRLVVTASGPTEPAWENPRLGHGFFTHYFLEALLGAEQVRDSGRIPVYRLLEYVTRRVIDAAQQIGRPQNPTLRGRIDGEFSWPVFTRGTRYRAAFPERAPKAISSSIGDLAAFGFPAGILDGWAGAIPTLNPLQIAAINEYGILSGDHLVVSAPTSSGKTMIGELAALRSVLERRRALFLFPLKALVNDKRRHFEDVYGPFGVRTIEATGETDDITPLLRGQYDVALLTYEKFAAVALTHPHVLEQAGAVVVDEVQMIADEHRGANLEFILTLLRAARRHGIEPQLVALSAVIGDTNGLERWLGARLLRRTERPVPLDEGIVLRDGRFRYIDGDTGAEGITPPVFHPIPADGNRAWVIPLVQRLVAEQKQVIVFRETKGEARHSALYLSEALALPAAADALAGLPGGDPSQASRDLRTALEGGVAFHNADLDRDERRVVEDAFRAPNASVRVIAATTTLAMGVNTPASAVVIVGLDHPGPTPYTVAEYKNLVGRAGRLGFSERGASFLLATDARTEHEYWRRYVTGLPEDLRSRFLESSTDPRTLIVRVLVAARRAAGEGIPPEEIIDFLEGSFGAFQEVQRNGAWRWSRADLSAALQDLLRHGLVSADADGKYRLSQLGRLAGQGACEVASVVRLVDCLRPLPPQEISDPVLITATQTTAELDAVLFPVNKKSKYKEPQTWQGELRRQGVPDRLIADLHGGTEKPHEPGLRAKKAVACLMYVAGTSMEDMERALTAFGGAFGGAAGPIRAVASRTSDVLPTTARVAEILHPGLDLGERLGRLLIRLESGIPGVAVDVAREAGTRLVRSDYLGLVSAGLSSPSAIVAATDNALLEILNRDGAKLTIIRHAATAALARARPATTVSGPVLRPYEP
jgi:replicative superfamily II helicase